MFTETSTIYWVTAMTPDRIVLSTNKTTVLEVARSWARDLRTNVGLIDVEVHYTTTQSTYAIQS